MVDRRAAKRESEIAMMVATSDRIKADLKTMDDPKERQVRLHSNVIGNARNEKVGKSHSCMVSSRKPGNKSRRRGF